MLLLDHYSDMYCNNQQYIMFGVKSLLMVKKVLLMRKNQVAVLFRQPMQRSQRWIPSCGQIACDGMFT